MPVVPNSSSLAERMKQLPAEQVLDPSRFMDYEASVVDSRLLDRALHIIRGPRLRVCDVGGATGVFLDTLQGLSAHSIEGTVMDLSGAYRQHLANDTLIFQQASIVDNDVADGTYDLVTARHVLHHLVGSTEKATIALQRKAIEEMLRITKPGGFVLIEEHVNQVKSFSRVIYYASRFANRWGLRWRYFEVGSVVVRFMTPGELTDMVETIANGDSARIVETEYEKREVGLRWKLTQLMAYAGDQLCVIQRA